MIHWNESTTLGGSLVINLGYKASRPLYFLCDLISPWKNAPSGHCTWSVSKNWSVVMDWKILRTKGSTCSVMWQWMLPQKQWGHANAKFSAINQHCVLESTHPLKLAWVWEQLRSPTFFVMWVLNTRFLWVKWQLGPLTRALSIQNFNFP